MDNKLELEDKIDELKVAEFFDEYEEFVSYELIPKAIAKYLAMAYSKDLLSPCPIRNHINSAIDVFNLDVDIDSIQPKTEEILSDKYGLKITDYELTKLEKVSK